MRKQRNESEEAGVLILFGLKVSSVLLATVSGVCQRCGRSGTHEIVRRARRLTVFFIPVLPVGTSYLDRCTVCGYEVRISREQAEYAATPGAPATPGTQSSPLPPAGPQDTPGWGPQDSPTWRP